MISSKHMFIVYKRTELSMHRSYA